MTLPTKFNSKELPVNYSAILEFKDTPPGIVEPLPELAKIRGSLKAIWLKEHRQEIMDYYTANGRVATMLRFHISAARTLENLVADQAVKKEEEDKHPETIWGQLPGEPNNSKGGGRKIPKGSPVPLGWYVYKRGTIYDYIKPVSEIASLRGGPKTQFLRIYREEIEEFYYEYGEEATKLRYQLKGETLDAVLQGGRHKPFVNKFTRVDKLEMSMDAYRDDVQDLRKEVKELREAFNQFQTEVAGQLMRKLLLPLVQNAINFGAETTEDIEKMLSSTRGKSKSKGIKTKAKGFMPSRG